MPKRGRHGNGYGCVTKLSGKRSKPWAVRVTKYNAEGIGYQALLGTAGTEEEAVQMLTDYKNNPWDIDRDRITLSELYQKWELVKMPKLSVALQNKMRSAYKHCAKYYGVKYRSLRAYQMQDCIDNCSCGYATQSAIKNMFGHLDRFAYERDIIDKMYSQLTKSQQAPETSRAPFTDDQINALWAVQDKPWVDTVLIYLYTGFRLRELLEMRKDRVNLEEGYFQGGIKSAAGKDRIVPIHPRIKPLVEARMGQNGEYLISNQDGKVSCTRYYQHWASVMALISADKTPHEARHTFETRLDNAGGNRKCIDMLMGHKSKDVGNRVYNHKTISQLRATIALIL